MGSGTPRMTRGSYARQERLGEGAMSEVTAERSERNLCALTLNATVSDSRPTGWAHDREESRTWCLGFGWAGGGGSL